MHILAPHGAGRCTAAAAKADLNVAKIRRGAKGLPRIATTSGFTSPIEFLEARHSLPIQRLARLPLSSLTIQGFKSAFCKEPNKAVGAAGIYSINAGKYLWETSQTSIIQSKSWHEMILITVQEDFLKTTSVFWRNQL